MVLIAVIVAVCMEVGLSPGDCVLDGDPAPSLFEELCIVLDLTWAAS